MLKAGRQRVPHDESGQHSPARGLRWQQLDNDLSLQRRLSRQEQSAHTAGRWLAPDDIVTQCRLQLFAKVEHHENKPSRAAATLSAKSRELAAGRRQTSKPNCERLADCGDAAIIARAQFLRRLREWPTQ
jgi:hypothetical protein